MTLSRLYVSSYGSLARRTLDIQCSVTRSAADSVSLRTVRVERRNWYFLTCSSCISKASPKTTIGCHASDSDATISALSQGE